MFDQCLEIIDDRDLAALPNPLTAEGEGLFPQKPPQFAETSPNYFNISRPIRMNGSLRVG